MSKASPDVLLQSPWANIPQVHLVAARRSLRSNKPWPHTPVHYVLFSWDPPQSPLLGQEFSTLSGTERLSFGLPACPVRNPRAPPCPTPALPGTRLVIQLLAAWKPGHGAPSQSPGDSGLWGRMVSPLRSPTLPGLGHTQAWTYTRILMPPPAEHFQTSYQMTALTPKSCTT